VTERTIETDVAVVGFGAAGAAAAIAAADLGAEVVILEKQAEGFHTPSSALAGYGIVLTVDDTDGATEYFDACSGGMVPRDVSASFAALARDLPDWLDRVANLEMRYIRGAQHPTLPSADALVVKTTHRRSAPGEPASDNPRDVDATGIGLFAALRDAVESRKAIRVLWESPARRLHRSAEGHAVTGVTAATSGGDLVVNTSRGVVLASGGFGSDEELKQNYLRAYPMFFYGNPGNSGDAVRMAQDAGAGLWHMNQVIGRGCMHFEHEGAGVTFNPSIYPIDYIPGSTFDEAQTSGFLITDRHGRRYADEWDQAIPVKHTFNFKMFEYDASAYEYPRIPSWWFFDSRRMEGGPLAMPRAGIGRTERVLWSDDNSVELRRGWIHQGATIAAAAAAGGIDDPALATESVAAYNDACAKGRDPLGRPSASLVPLDRPPFYCVPLYPGGTSTLGGPRIDGRARVLDPFGDPIDGLYAAGEVSLPFGMLYPSSGGNLSAALCFGRAAAQTALRG
jgi:succinate dehydrogenase/fumarate reductase flavoprotein subunit